MTTYRAVQTALAACAEAAQAVAARAHTDLYYRARVARHLDRPGAWLALTAHPDLRWTGLHAGGPYDQLEVHGRWHRPTPLATLARWSAAELRSRCEFDTPAARARAAAYLRALHAVLLELLALPQPPPAPPPPPLLAAIAAESLLAPPTWRAEVPRALRPQALAVWLLARRLARFRDAPRPPLALNGGTLQVLDVDGLVYQDRTTYYHLLDWRVEDVCQHPLPPREGGATAAVELLAILGVSDPATLWAACQQLEHATLATSR